MAQAPKVGFPPQPHSLRARLRAGPLFLSTLACLALAAAGTRAQEQPSEYAGSEACQACHEDLHKAFEKNPHALVDKDKRRGWDGKACESCHGPGAKHAESAAAADIRNPGKLAVNEADKVCLTCHRHQATHMARLQSAHTKNQVGCANCHSVHKPGPEGTPAGFATRKPAAVNKLCSSCHTTVWAEFQRPHRHRLPENAMSCVDCHSAHGSVLPRSQGTFAANQTACFKCHGDKRGPFVFEHAPVRLEGCSSCHETHGSANPRMLTRHEVRFQCLECHSNLPARQADVLGGIPPALHDLRSARFRNCTICHSKIHGSHVSRALLR